MADSRFWKLSACWAGENAKAEEVFPSLGFDPDVQRDETNFQDDARSFREVTAAFLPYTG